MSFAKKQAAERAKAASDKKDFLYHLLAAKNSDGTPAYSDPRDIASESRQLIVAGLFSSSIRTRNIFLTS